MTDAEENQVVSGPDWSRLPPELLAHTFKYLSVQGKGRTARVCVNWRDASYQKSVWKDEVMRWTSKINLTDNGTLVSSLTTRSIQKVRMNSSALLDSVAREFPGVLSMKIDGNLNDTRVDVNTFIIALRNLKELCLWDVSGISDSTVQLISENLGELKLLSLRSNRILTRVSFLAISRGLKKLEHLFLRSVQTVNDGGIAYLTGCHPRVVTSPPPKLKYLNVSLCTLLTNKDMLYLSVGQPELEYLDLSHSLITNVGVKRLSSLKQLVELNLTRCYQFNGGAIKYLASLPRLRHLNLSRSRIDDAGLAGLATGPCASGITILQLCSCSNVSDDGLKWISKLVNLQMLDLSRCNITDVGLANLVQGASKITCLSVSRCIEITDTGVRHLSEMAHLTRLSLSLCDNITRDGIAILVTGGAPVTVLNWLPQLRLSSTYSYQKLLSSSPIVTWVLIPIFRD